MSSPKSGGIRVRRNTMVTVEGGQPPEHQSASPVTTTIRSTPTPQGSRPKSLAGLAGSSNLLNEMLRSDTLSRRGKKMPERDTAKHLISFFRETSPPPGNYMSTPDTPDGALDEETEQPQKNAKRFSLWSFQKRFRRNKQPKTQKGLIRLPDSAVAGRTTGGYRHIAISIPIEYAHLEPVRPKLAVTEPELRSEPFGKEEGNDVLGYPERQSWSEMPCPAGNNGLLPPGVDTGPFKGFEEGAHCERVEHSQATNTSVGPRRVIAPSSPELTMPPKGSACANWALTNAQPNHLRARRHRPLTPRRSTESERLPSARRSLDLELVRRPSTPESFYTTTSELISSDAVTVHIPSLSSSPELSHSPHSVDSDAETDSYYTPELAHSPLTISAQDTGDAYSLSENSSPRFNFSATHNGSTSCTSSMHEPAAPYPTFDTNEPYQPHTLSDITSLESLLPSSLGSESFHIAPFMTPADVWPPSPLHHADYNNERHPRRVHALSDIRSTNHSHSSLLSLPLPHEEEEEENEEPFPAYDHGHSILTPTTNPSCYPSTYSIPLSTPAPRSMVPHTFSNTHTHINTNMNTHMNLLHNYNTLTQTREHDMDALLGRLDRLEQANNTWLSTLVPLLEQVSRRLGVTETPFGSMVRKGGGSGSLSLRGWPSSLLAGYGGGGGDGEGVDFGPRHGYGTSLGYDESRGQTLDQGQGQRERYGGGGIMPARLGSMLSVDSFDWGRVGDLRHRGPGGLGSGSAGSGRGLRDSGVVEDQEDEERRDINEESWLRSNSSSREGCSAWASREGVLDGYGHGALEPLDQWRSRSRVCLGDGGGWGVTFAGRQAAAFVRKQQRQGDDWALEHEEELGDAAGLGALEVLMRDLVLGTSTRNQSVEGRTLVDDSMLGVCHPGSNGHGFGG